MWEPFNREFLHRQYSASKSFVSIAIGFCEQDGLLKLNDRISDYFSEYFTDRTDNYYTKQTIRDMLMMSTEKRDGYWFGKSVEDRVKFYFDNNRTETKGNGLLFNYDSSASFVLCALVERLTNMSFMDYLRIKLFDKIGVSKEAYCLKCPGGHSWGDSGILCTARDLLLVAKFVMNKGKWGEEQILNEQYLVDATSKLIDNNYLGYYDHDTQGYGYQIWRT